MIEKFLYGALVGDTGVSALIGKRFYPFKAPERRSPANAATDPGSFPHATYSRISTRRVKSQGGSVGLTFARLQIDCWGLVYADAKKLAEAVRVATVAGTGGTQRLDGFKQDTAFAVFVQSCWLSDDRDGYDAPAHGDDVGIYRTSMDAACWFNEASS